MSDLPVVCNCAAQSLLSQYAVPSCAGVTGIALAMAGAKATLSDLPHITPLTQRNVENNLGVNQSLAQVTAAASAVLPWALQACIPHAQNRSVANRMSVEKLTKRGNEEHRSVVMPACYQL